MNIHAYTLYICIYIYMLPMTSYCLLLVCVLVVVLVDVEVAKLVGCLAGSHHAQEVEQLLLLQILL